MATQIPRNKIMRSLRMTKVYQEIYCASKEAKSVGAYDVRGQIRGVYFRPVIYEAYVYEDKK